MSCQPADYNPVLTFLKLTEKWLARQPWLQIRPGQLFEVRGSGRKPLYCSVASERHIVIHSSVRQIDAGLARWIVEFTPAPADIRETYRNFGWPNPGLEPGLWSLKRGKPRPGEREDYERVVPVLEMILASLGSEPPRPLHDVFELPCGCEWTVRWPLRYVPPRACPRCQEKARPATPLGRNESCWCGSGKKYKKCHLDSDRAAG